MTVSILINFNIKHYVTLRALEHFSIIISILIINPLKLSKMYGF